MITAIDRDPGTAGSREDTGVALGNHAAPVAAHVAPAQAVRRTPPPEAEQVTSDAAPGVAGSLSIETFAVASILEFADGTEPSIQILHIGDLDSCKLVMAGIHAISYSGDHPVAVSRLACRRWPPPEN